MHLLADGTSGVRRRCFASALVPRLVPPRWLPASALPRTLTSGHSVSERLHAIANRDLLGGLPDGGLTPRHALGVVLQRPPQVSIACVEDVLRRWLPKSRARPRPNVGPSN